MIALAISPKDAHLVAIIGSSIADEIAHATVAVPMAAPTLWLAGKAAARSALAARPFSVKLPTGAEATAPVNPKKLMAGATSPGVKVIELVEVNDCTGPVTGVYLSVIVATKVYGTLSAGTKLARLPVPVTTSVLP